LDCRLEAVAFTLIARRHCRKHRLASALRQFYKVKTWQFEELLAQPFKIGLNLYAACAVVVFDQE